MKKRTGVVAPIADISRKRPLAPGPANVRECETVKRAGLKIEN